MKRDMMVWGTYDKTRGNFHVKGTGTPPEGLQVDTMRVHFRRGGLPPIAGDTLCVWVDVTTPYAVAPSPGAGVAGTVQALRALMTRLGGRIPYASASAARTAALRQTEADERDGLQLLVISLPPDAAALPDPSGRALEGPMRWWDWGDDVNEAAEEYGIAAEHIHVVEHYEAADGVWVAGAIED